MYIMDLGFITIFFILPKSKHLYLHITAMVYPGHSRVAIKNKKKKNPSNKIHIKICLYLTSKCNNSHGQAVLSSLIENHLSNFN